MQIGNPELDLIYESVIKPTIKECGLIPKRVDKDEQGDIITKEIFDFIERSGIVIADLTNERPSCYLEVGYTLGIEKEPKPIFCARKDHDPRLPNRKEFQPKVHFDLDGYNILYWTPDRLEDFKNALKEKIKTRKSMS